MAIDSSNTNCVLCDKIFGSQSNLDFHIKTIHLRMLVCSKCPNYSTLIKIRMERHYRNVHQSEMPLEPLAGPGYVKAGAGEQNVTMRSFKPDQPTRLNAGPSFPCYHCAFTATSRSGLSNHFNGKHKQGSSPANVVGPRSLIGSKLASSSSVQVITISNESPAKAGLAKLTNNKSITITTSTPENNTGKIPVTVDNAKAMDDIEMVEIISHDKLSEIVSEKATESGTKAETKSTSAIDLTNLDSKHDSNPSEDLMVEEENAESLSFGCDNCWLVFDSKEDLSEHALEMHGIATKTQTENSQSVEEAVQSTDGSTKESTQMSSGIGSAPKSATISGSDRTTAIEIVNFRETTDKPSTTDSAQAEQTMDQSCPGATILSL